MLSLTILSPVSIDARMGALKTHHAHVKYHYDNSQQQSISYSDDADVASQNRPLSFLEESSNLPPEQPPQALSRNSRRGLSSSIRTAVADLAYDFQSAFQALNQEDKDIHVGRLLTACERLEDTMRKIGFNQGAKDIGGNIRKIRNLYNIAPPSQRDSMPSLLRYEMEIGVHNDESMNTGEGGMRRMKDPSAAIGFLWLGRTLNYQYDLFRLMLDENEDPYNAARRAYDQDLKQHHSWAVQKVCQAAMVTLKPMRKTAVLSSLGGFEEDRFGQQENEATHRDLNEMMNSWKPLLSRWRKVFSDLQLESLWAHRLALRFGCSRHSLYIVCLWESILSRGLYK